MMQFFKYLFQTLEAWQKPPKNPLAKLLLTSLLLLAFSEQSFGQRLLIEIQGQAKDFPKIIYGRIEKDSLWIFEQKYPLIKKQTPAVSKSEQAHLPEQPTLPIDMQPAKSLVANFIMMPAEKSSCTKTKRFQSFVELTKSLADNLAMIEVHVLSGWEECARAVQQSLEKQSFKTHLIDSPQAKQFELSLYLVKTAQKEIIANELDKSSSQDGDTKIIETTEISPKMAAASDAAAEATPGVLLVNQEKPEINAIGFFLKEITSAEPITITYEKSGYETLNIKTRPIVVGEKVFSVSNAGIYHERKVMFGSQNRQIMIVPVPHFNAAATFDGGLGGGFGYGREVPGEEKGKRLYTQIGAELREAYQKIGLRAQLAYSNSSKSTVPYTVTGRGFLFYDRPFFHGRLVNRFGVGGEFLLAKTKNTGSSSASAEAAIIPEQVVAPALLEQFQYIMIDRLYLSGQVIFKPLYVAGAGLFNSYSPAIEAGYEFNENLRFSLAWGSDAFIYPSALGDTKLTIDYVYLNLKLGLF